MGPGRSAELEAAQAELRRLRDASTSLEDAEAVTLQALQQEHDAKQAALSRGQARP